MLGCCQERPGRAASALEMEQPWDRDAQGRKFPKHPSFERKFTQPCSWSLHPCWVWALHPESSRRRRYSSKREAVAEAQKPGCSCLGGGHVQTKAATEGGEYIKITGTVIAFYINVLFKSFPQCESPSLKRINSLHTNLFCACRWSIMMAPLSTTDQEASGFHLT